MFGYLEGVAANFSMKNTKCCAGRAAAGLGSKIIDLAKSTAA